MNKYCPPTWLCLLVLTLALLWKLMGAPISVEEFENLQTPVWQARVLLPSRFQRILMQWFETETNKSDVFENRDPDEAAMQQVLAPQEAVWVNVYLNDEKRMSRMSLEGYVCGVVAAEMPAAYHMEALKAQAVAARTRALYQISNNGCAAHEGADLCTDSAHCQAYATPAQCATLWKDSYEVYKERVMEAGKQTQGKWMSYDGEPITVLYHAISGGRTENAQTVFSQALPYLVSVESTGEEKMRGFQEDAVFTYQEIVQKLKPSLGNLKEKEIRQTLSVTSYTETGRVATVQVGTHQVPATILRKLLGLRSTWFSLALDEENVVFHQQGYGHGVGMSQAGANSMAGNGKKFDEILLHYYPGITIETNE